MQVWGVRRYAWAGFCPRSPRVTGRGKVNASVHLVLTPRSPSVQVHYRVPAKQITIMKVSEGLMDLESDICYMKFKVVKVRALHHDHRCAPLGMLSRRPHAARPNFLPTSPTRFKNSLQADYPD